MASGIITVLLHGLSQGMLLFIIAAGLSVIFGLMGIINFAHGALYALGAYLGFTLLNLSDSFLVAVIAAPVIVGLIGYVIEIGLIRRIYDADPIYQLLLLFGIAVVIDEALLLVWGAQTNLLAPPDLLRGATELPFGVLYPSYRLFIIGIGLIIALSLWIFTRRTRTGTIIRAGTLDRGMVAVLGINIDRLFSVVFSFGVGLAALGGILAAPIYSVYPHMGIEVLIDAFIVVIIGGLGGIRGAFYGALVIGFINAGASTYADQFSGVVLFVLLIVILLVRPTGLFGEEGYLDH